MSAAVAFDILARDGLARRGRMSTAHGTVDTPAFMTVGTAATVKAMTADAVRESGAQIILANTYHLMLRPGPDVVESLGGLHRFADWPGPILTDSGGFQIMSLSGLRQLREAGVTFRSHIDGSSHTLTPESAVAIQRQLDADITMVLDECTAYPVGHEEAAKSMQLSMRWAARSKAAFEARPGYGLFAIVQGSVFEDLRADSAQALSEIGFDGYAIGGLAVGEGQAQMFAVLEMCTAQLPAERPRYLMGVGKPDDMVGAVARGVDMFDCVLPTRSGRTGQAFTRRGAVNLRNARHARDPRPLDEKCRCPACRRHSRGYLHHLVRAKEMLAATLVTWHNLTYYHDLMAALRGAIEEQRLDAFRRDFAAAQAASDIAPV